MGTDQSIFDHILGVLKKPANMVIWGWIERSSATFFQWEFQDPKMEVLYHIRPYFAGIFPEI
jgi:hypothetical protein